MAAALHTDSMSTLTGEPHMLLRGVSWLPISMVKPAKSMLRMFSR